MVVVNWQNDSVYFDTEPKEVIEWINANELIENNRRENIFLTDSTTLNLYPILVRKADFVRKNPSDRILARLPFIQVTEEEREVFKDQELLVSERLRDYFYKSDNRKILEWRDILRNYLERGAVPLPFFRCYPDEWGFELHNRILESSRGETFGMPTTLTNELAYLCGMVNGDGSLTKYVLNIIDYSLENIRQLKEQFERLFQQTGRIQMQTENSPALIITNLWVVRLFSFLTDQPIGGKKYHKLREPLLLQQQPFRSYYWSGVMDADGSYANGNVRLVSASDKYIKDFSSFLQTIGVNSKCKNRGDGTYHAYIPRNYHHIYKMYLKCLHPEKKHDFHKLKKGRIKNEKKAKFFHSFNEETIINGYFNFELLENVMIVGVGSKIKQFRGEFTQKEFSKKIGITASMLSLIEQNKSTVSIKVTRNILQQTTNFGLMPWLFSLGKTIQFRRGNAQPIHLVLKPSPVLEYISKKLIFYPTSTKINSKVNSDFIEKIKKTFGVEVSNNLILNGALRHFFTTFCILEEK